MICPLTGGENQESPVPLRDGCVRLRMAGQERHFFPPVTIERKIDKQKTQTK